MAGCSLTFLNLLLVCVVWGTWLHCIKGDCGEIRRIKFYPPDNGRYLEGHVFLNRSIGIHRQCEEQCLLESECVSINIGPPSNDKFVCELSNSDHVQHPQDLKLRRNWQYKGIENLCVSNPCVNYGKCLMGFTNKKYLCVCKIGFTGGNCENGPSWLKVNTKEVCFGARDDSYGTFSMPHDGDIASFKLVHLSGRVSCAARQNRFSNWGCDLGEYLATFLTNVRNKIVFPQISRAIGYKLSGIWSNSKELTFNNLTVPMKVSTGQQFRVWYGEDLRDVSEHDNRGKTCLDVFALYV